MKQQLERQTFSTTAGAAKFATVNEGGIEAVTGYALVWNQLSSDRGGYFVRFKRGSARYDPNVHALWNHNDDFLVGCTANGSLEIAEDDYGLKFTLRPAPTQPGRDLLALVQGGFVTGVSFGTTPLETKETIENGQTVIEYITHFVDEISPCGRPAFEATTIAPLATPLANEDIAMGEALAFQNLRLDH